MPPELVQKQPQENVIQIVITMTGAGAIAVTGPIENKLLCYGLLDIAKEVVAEHCKQAEQRVNPASSHEIAALAAAGIKRGS